MTSCGLVCLMLCILIPASVFVNSAKSSTILILNVCVCPCVSICLRVSICLCYIINVVYHFYCMLFCPQGPDGGYGEADRQSDGPGPECAHQRT